MSFSRHVRWLFPIIMFIAVIAVTVGLVVGMPKPNPLQLADSSNGTNLTNGTAVLNGTSVTSGTDGISGTNGTNGTDGTTGTITPKIDYNFFFFFGDSYTNTAFDPNGAQPSPSKPFGNNALSSTDETLAGGPNWAEDLTSMYGSKTTLSYNYAYNCGTVDNAIVGSCGPNVRTIVKQVANFAQTLQKGSVYESFYPQNTLYAIWIGINDAHITANNGQIQDKDVDPIMEKVANRLMEQLSTLYGLGARNFLLLNVPPFDRTPQVLETPKANILRQRNTIISLNRHFSASFQLWRSTHPTIKSLFIDTIPIFNEALDDPTKIGDKNGTCDTGRRGASAGCVWFNDFHPAVNMHRWIAFKVREKAKVVWGELFT